MSITSNLLETHKRQVNKIVKEAVNIEIFFISFNYTNILEQILERDSGGNARYVAAKDNENKIMVINNEVTHIHGEINNTMILGVDNEEQMCDGFFEENDKVYLIKPAALNESYDFRLEEADEKIEKSDIIILFGLSLGETDKTRWVKIIEWLQQDKKILIIHDYNDGNELDKTLVGEIRERISEIQNIFLSYSNIDDKIKESLKKKIIIDFYNFDFFNSGK